MKHVFKKPMVTILDTSVLCDEEKYKEAYSAVSQERRKKVDAYRLPKDKRLSLGAGVLLEQGLARLGIQDYSLRYGENKKPYLVGCPKLFFSLSHSEPYAVCAFFDKEIGMDVERVSDVSEGVMRKVTTEKEYAFLQNLSAEQKKEQFTRLWTAKESYTKYLGTGLSLSPQTLEVTLGETLAIMHGGMAAGVVFTEHTQDGYKITVCHGAE